MVSGSTYLILNIFEEVLAYEEKKPSKESQKEEAPWKDDKNEILWPRRTGISIAL